MLARTLPLYRLVLYNFYYRHVLRFARSARVNGIKLVIKPTVMHPKLFKSGKVFSDFLLTQDLSGKRVLDMGTGSGILALTAAKQGARVSASDVNPVAVQCAAENFRANGLSSEDRVFSGHLFSQITEKEYDLILFNPPYLEHSNNSAHHLALHGGEHLELIREFADHARSFLRPGGSLLLITSTDSNVPLFLDIFLERNYSPELLYKTSTLFETLYIYRFVPSSARKNESVFLCPSCREQITQAQNNWECNKEKLTFPQKNGIHDFILPDRRAGVERFLNIYRAVRNHERWGSKDTRYYEELPYRDTTNEHSPVWSIRARSFERFKKQLELNLPLRPLQILDLGAGNGWFSLRLTKLGHDVTAVDVYDDEYDGLGVLNRIKKYLSRIQLIKAEFDHLPFPSDSFDVIVFNASLHYAAYPPRLIEKTFPYLKEGGTMFIMDSPMYRDDASGNAMLDEKAESFKRVHGITIEHELRGSFITPQMFDHFKKLCTVEIFAPSNGLALHFRRTLARLRGKREPATFAVIQLTKHKH